VDTVHSHMSNFQKRFKNKTSAITKEGLIPSLDKYPASNGGILKVPILSDKKLNQSGSNGRNNLSLNQNVSNNCPFPIKNKEKCKGGTFIIRRKNS